MITNNLSNAQIKLPLLPTSGPTVSGPGKAAAYSDLALQGSSASILSYPLDTPKYFMSFLIYKYSRQNLNTIGTLTQDTNYSPITLPLPQQLVDVNSENWADIDVGTGVGTLASTGSDLLGTPGAIAGAIGSVAASTAAGVGSLIPGSAEAAAALEAKTGIIPNMFTTILFRGPKYKRHRFSWDLSPQNFSEADTLRQIVNQFKNAMSPNYYQITQGGGPVLWQFPHLFKISLYPNSKQLYKFKPCVIEAFAANYTPANRASFYVNSNGTTGDNAPEGLSLQMNLIEVEFWVENNFTDSNDPSDVYSSNPAGTLTNLLNTSDSAVAAQQLNIPVPSPF